jgi:hypothetical protein
MKKLINEKNKNMSNKINAIKNIIVIIGNKEKNGKPVDLTGKFLTQIATGLVSSLSAELSEPGVALLLCSGV